MAGDWCGMTSDLWRYSSGFVKVRPVPHRAAGDSWDMAGINGSTAVNRSGTVRDSWGLVRVRRGIGEGTAGDWRGYGG